MLNFMKSRYAWRTLLFTFFALFNCCLLAQEIDPYKFFPSSVGNVWEYAHSSGTLRYEIVSDSLLPDSSKYIYFAPNSDPVYRIGLNYEVFWIPTDSSLNWLYYKLDADTGFSWIVDIHHIIDTFYVYKLAKVRSIYEGIFFNRYTTFKEITYYQYQPDSIINEFSWPEYTETLAFGIGLVSVFDEEGGGPERILQGCIIDGDTIGIITSVENEIIGLNSFELFQNYPNPFNPTTTIKYSIAEPQKVKLIIYTLLGEEVQILVDDYKFAGNHSVIFNASDLASGVYIYTLFSGNQSTSKKLILLK
ncbi:MAG: T9SS type A sorting domain-containing protein [Ignavibacteriaceae bacterium]